MFPQRNRENVCNENYSFRQRVFLLLKTKFCKYRGVGSPKHYQVQSILFRHAQGNLSFGNGVFALPWFERYLNWKRIGNFLIYLGIEKNHLRNCYGFRIHSQKAYLSQRHQARKHYVR